MNNLLENKKVYVGKHREIHQKSIRLGWRFDEDLDQRELDDSPFLIFKRDKEIIVTNSLIKFNITFHDYEEVTPEWILSLPEFNKDITKEKNVKGFYINNKGEISKEDCLYNPDEMSHFRFFSTESLAKAWVKLPELLYWRDKYNEGWIADFRRPDYKHIIKCHKDIPAPEDGRSYNEILAFKDREIRNKFLRDFKELIDICKPLL